MLYGLVSDVLYHIGWINSPLNLANMKIQKLKFVRNTAQDARFHAQPQTGAYSCFTYLDRAVTGYKYCTQ